MRRGAVILVFLMVAWGCGSGSGSASPPADGGGADVQKGGGDTAIRESDAGTTVCMRYAAPGFINNGIAEIVAGPDGNYWVTETIKNAIARTGPTTESPGMLKEFGLPKPQSEPYNLVVGPDRNLWFAEKGPSGIRIARMTTTGTLDEFPFPAETYPSAVVRGGFVPGADGKLWFIRTNAPFKLGSITTAGVITDDEAPIPSMPLALGAEPSGAILVLMQLGSDTPDHSWDYKLARRSPSGEMTAFPKTATAMRGPVVEGSDGTIWIGSMLELHNTGSGTKLTPAVVRVTGLGSNEGARYETFPLGFPYETLPNLVNALFAGPDGDVFFSLNRDSGVGSMTYAGRVTKAGEIQFFSAQSFGTLLVDDDGNLWTTTLGSVDCNKPTVIDVFPKPDGGGADSFDVAVERSSPDVNAVDGPGPTPDATVDAATEPTQD